MADTGQSSEIKPEHRDLMARQAEVASRGYELLAELDRAKADFQAVRAEMLRTNIDVTHILDYW
ncbi:hypothetical protein ACFWBF_00760 [Streptomyces sp. NPDC060028]|uniref:hypothetical protein n=1 Tax=Streptomyces sp. NPDC060028 TaxID=3347041 RepID=UPI0036C524A2